MERTATLSNIRRMGIALLAASLLIGLALVGVGTSNAEAAGDRQSVAAVPGGFDQYLVYMAQPRIVDEPTVVNYETFKEFQAEVYGRDDAAIADFRQEAIDFYAERFGLDFSGAAVQADGSQQIDGATLSPSFVAPETEYRAYTIGGMRVPAEGHVVRDSSLNVMIQPGTVLHGEYGGAAGKVAAQGGLLAFGDYNILVPGPGNSGNADEIQIRFKSTGPIVPNADGVMTFVCDLEHEAWGDGQARGIVTPNGEIRNVLAFPDA